MGVGDGNYIRLKLVLTGRLIWAGVDADVLALPASAEPSSHHLFVQVPRSARI